jgi:hypothetical protein
VENRIKHCGTLVLGVWRRSSNFYVQMVKSGEQDKTLWYPCFGGLEEE